MQWLLQVKDFDWIIIVDVSMLSTHQLFLYLIKKAILWTVSSFFPQEAGSLQHMHNA